MVLKLTVNVIGVIELIFSNLTFNEMDFIFENSTNINIVSSNLYNTTFTLTGITNFNVTNNVISIGSITLGSCNNGSIKNNHIGSIYVNNCKEINSDVKIDGISSTNLTCEPYTKTNVYDMLKDGCLVHSEDGKIGYIFNKSVKWLTNPIS